MNTKIILGLCVAGCVGLIVWSSNSKTVPQQENTPVVESGSKEFIVTGENYRFSPTTLTVKKGDTVKITLKNLKGFHDFRIDEFGVFTEKIQDGGEDTIEFVADKQGSFEYYCSVGAHRQSGMKGTLIVE